MRLGSARTQVFTVRPAVQFHVFAAPYIVVELWKVWINWLTSTWWSLLFLFVIRSDKIGLIAA